MLPFLLLTFTVTWTAFFWAPAWPAQSWPASVLLILGTFAPGIVALGLITRETGRPGLYALGERIVDLQFSWRWYAFALGYVAALKGTAAVLHRVMTGTWPIFGGPPLVVLPVVILTSAVVQAGEEVGWRGYALPRLARRFGFSRAGVLLGVIWGVWHLPLFAVPGNGNYGQSFWLFVFGSTALSIAMTWLFVNTRGSVGLAMLMHSAVNQTSGLVPTRRAQPGNPLTVLDTSLISMLVAGLLLVASVYLLWRIERRT